jgi:hypothetical protein
VNSERVKSTKKKKKKKKNEKTLTAKQAAVITQASAGNAPKSMVASCMVPLTHDVVPFNIVVIAVAIELDDDSDDEPFVVVVIVVVSVVVVAVVVVVVLSSARIVANNTNTHNNARNVIVSQTPRRTSLNFSFFLLFFCPFEYTKTKKKHMISDSVVDVPSPRSVNANGRAESPRTPHRNTANASSSSSSSTSTTSSLVRRASAAFDRLRRSTGNSSRPASPAPTSPVSATSNNNNNHSPPQTASPRGAGSAAGTPVRSGAANQFYIRVFPNAVLSRASPPDAPLRCWVVPMPPAATDADDDHESEVAAATADTASTGNSIADSFEIDESDTFQFLWTAFAHVLNESVPLDVQLIVRTPAGTDRKIFGKLNDEDVKMGLPCGLPASLRSATLESTSPVNISRAASVDLAGTEDLLAALDSIDIDDICTYSNEPLPNSLSSVSLSLSPPSPTSSTSSQQPQQSQQSQQQQQPQQPQQSPSPLTASHSAPLLDESTTLNSPLSRSSSAIAPPTADTSQQQQQQQTSFDAIRRVAALARRRRPTRCFRCTFPCRFPTLW